MKEKIKRVIQFITNPRFLLCFGIAWIITNGWCYVFIALGSWLDIPWMLAIGSAYMAFLWFPFTPEKILTFSISIALLRFFFPKDTKTLAVLMDLYKKAHASIHEFREKRKAKRFERQQQKS